MEELGIPGIHQDSEATAGELFSHVMLMVVYSQGYIIAESLYILSLIIRTRCMHTFWVWLIGCMGVLPLRRLLPSSVVVLFWGGGHASLGGIKMGLPLPH